MKFFRVVCKTDQDFVKALLAVNKDNIIFGYSESQKIIDIPDLDAFKSGLSNLRKVLSKRKCYLRYYWFDGNNKTLDVTSEDFEFLPSEYLLGTTSGSLGIIDRHKEKENIYSYYKGISFCSQYQVNIKDLRIEYRYDSRTSVPIEDFMRIEYFPPDSFFNRYNTEKERTVEVLREILECTLTYK